MIVRIGFSFLLCMSLLCFQTYTGKHIPGRPGKMIYLTTKPIASPINTNTLKLTCQRTALLYLALGCLVDCPYIAKMVAKKVIVTPPDTIVYQAFTKLRAEKGCFADLLERSIDMEFPNKGCYQNFSSADDTQLAQKIVDLLAQHKPPTL